MFSQTMGLFTNAADRSAFRRAGLSTDHDSSALIGRGTWVSQRMSIS